jgi:hypothetical protein
MADSPFHGMEAPAPAAFRGGQAAGLCMSLLLDRLQQDAAAHWERRSHHGLYESLKKKFQTVVGKRTRGRYDHLPVPVTRLDETAFVSKSAGENRSANHIAISIR